MDVRSRRIGLVCSIFVTQAGLQQGFWVEIRYGISTSGHDPLRELCRRLITYARAAGTRVQRFGHYPLARGSKYCVHDFPVQSAIQTGWTKGTEEVMSS